MNCLGLHSLSITTTSKQQKGNLRAEVGQWKAMRLSLGAAALASKLSQGSPYALRECGHSNGVRRTRRNMKDLLHIAVGVCGCLLRSAAVLSRTQVGRVPVPPV